MTSRFNNKTIKISFVLHIFCVDLQLELEREHQEYEDLTAKYDLLEEDYVVIKAKLVMDKQAIEK